MHRKKVISIALGIALFTLIGVTPIVSNARSL